MSQEPRTLVGRDVWVYALAPGGTPQNPTIGQYFNMLGRWKDISISFTVERADTTPGAQDLKEKTYTGLDWKATVNHQIRSGGGILTGLLFNGNLDLKCIFQEEENGATFTMYGGITEGEYKRGREGAMEAITFENTGPRGNSGSSIFYSYNGAANFDAASVQTLSVQSFSTLSAANFVTNGAGVVLDPTGFRGR